MLSRFRENDAIALLILAAAGLGLLWLRGNRLIFSNDEGIILDASVRMLHGQSLYRDFFGYMSPGSYWLQEATFRLFGVTQLAGRVLVIFDFALQCAVLFWLTARLAGKAVGLAATILFFAFQLAAPEFLLAQHRMDSAALSLASVCLSLKGRQRTEAWWCMAAGVLIVAAAVCTPSIALLAPVAVVWMWSDRRLAAAYCCGMGATLVVITAALASTGSLAPFLTQMMWLRRNYSAVNVMPYGSVIGGYRAAGTLGWLFLAWPAVLPAAAPIAWSLRLRRDWEWAVRNGIPYLLACMVAYVVSTYPRADVAHLAFVAVLPAMLTAVWIARYVSRFVAASLLGVLMAGAALILVSGQRANAAVHTPIGTLEASSADAIAVAALLAAVGPQDSLYVHPYNPMLYFLTQARNPTRYSYLAPGMMTSYDEAVVLTALRVSPPKWVLKSSISRSEFLRVFPHAGRLDHRFPLIEDWLARNYLPAEPPVSVAGYRLYKHGLIPITSTTEKTPPCRGCVATAEQ